MLRGPGDPSPSAPAYVVVTFLNMTTRTLALALTSVAATAGVSSASAAVIPVGSIPATSANAAGFAPPGWLAEKKVRGDLDRDGDRDLAIVLVQDPKVGSAYGVNDGSRALVFARRDPSGTLRRSGVAPLLLGCRECGGAFWGASGMPVNLSFSGGNVVVNQQFGSRELTSTVHRIRWNTTRRKFRLVGLDTVLLDRGTLTSTEVSTNHLTGRQVTTKKNGSKLISRTTRTVKVSPRPIAGLVFGSTKP